MSSPARIGDLLTREEIRELTRVSDLRGAWSVLASVGITAAALALAAWQPNPLTIVAALVLVGCRQLGFLVLMHEAAHRSLFSRRALNDAVGAVCGALVWGHLAKYREHHLRHHIHTGTEGDPDLGLVDPFPVSGGSLARKLLRDLTGITGVKRIYGLLAMDLGFIGYTASTGVVPIDQEGRATGDVVRTGLRNLLPVLSANGVLLLALVAAGHPWLFLLWLGAYLTTFSVILRIRSMAEHACTDRSADPFRNTRTTRASPLARLTLAPHQVNFHLEHHLLMTVPHYRLPAMRALLAERGGLAGTHSARGYREVLQIVGAGSTAARDLP